MAIDKNEHPQLHLAVTRVLPLPVLELLRSRHNVWVNPDDRTLTPDELQQAARRADVLLITAFDRLDADPSQDLVTRTDAKIRFRTVFTGSITPR
jgi:hypothetical protein